MAEPPRPRIEILQVPDCPLAEPLREAVRRALARCGIEAEIENRVGDYPSPTLLVDGRDPTGRQLDVCGSCRLDVPTEDEVVAVLRRRHPRPEAS